jgi:hypothetical protein
LGSCGLAFYCPQPFRALWLRQSPAIADPAATLSLRKAQERACLSQGDVRAFLDGGLPASVLGSSSQRQLLAQVQEHVVALGQVRMGEGPGRLTPKARKAAVRFGQSFAEL